MNSKWLNLFLAILCLFWVVFLLIEDWGDTVGWAMIVVAANAGAGVGNLTQFFYKLRYEDE